MVVHHSFAEHYQVARARLQQQLGYHSIMQVPRLVKVVINSGVKDAVQNKKSVTLVAQQLAKITGQKPIITKAKKSIASFKTRTGMPIGVKVTLRRAKMFDFLHKLLHIQLPRVREFHGWKKSSFDLHGNFSWGIDNQLIFPEIDFSDVDRTRGFDITIVTTAQNPQTGAAFLASLGFLFERNPKTSAERTVAEH